MDASTRRELDQLERALVHLGQRLDHDSQQAESLAAHLGDLRGRLARPEPDTAHYPDTRSQIAHGR